MDVTRRLALPLSGVLLFMSCVPMTGAPSLTLLTRDAGVEAGFVAVADRSKASDCFH